MRRVQIRLGRDSNNGRICEIVANDDARDGTSTQGYAELNSYTWRYQTTITGKYRKKRCTLCIYELKAHNRKAWFNALQ